MKGQKERENAEMKFRTDFVTNSSDSSFLAFNIKNKKLFDCLTGLGIKFENVKDGEFSDRMRIVLPSGESDEIDGANNWSLPYLSDFSSISAWLVAMILWEVEDIYPAKEEEDYSDFARELIELLNKADITHLEWDAIDTWSREKMIRDLEHKFGEMDSDIKDASIEHTYGFEGDVGPCIYTEVHDGKKMSVEYSNQDEIETEKCDGLKFVVTGKLKYYDNREAIVDFIEDEGGTVSESVSKNTDYLICNDVTSTSSKMKKAKQLGIPVLTELAFIRRFADIEDFDDIPEEETVGEDSWDMTSDGGVLDFVIENGTQPIVMEIWIDGKWQQCISEQKIAAKNAALLAKRNEAKQITSQLLTGEYGSTLKRLLCIKERNCLSTNDDTPLQMADSTFEELCTRGSLRFELGPIEAQEEKDCFLIVEKEMSKSIFGDPEVFLMFTILCKHDICDLDGYKNRALEIASLIIDAINDKDLDGTGKLHYRTFSSHVISEEYACYSLKFKIGEDTFSSQTEDENPIKGYNDDNAAVVEEILKDSSLKAVMGIEGVSDEDAYLDGYIRLSEALAPNTEKPRQSWIILNWEFLMGTSLTVAPVCTDLKTLNKISGLLKERLSGLALPIRNKLNYSEDSSKEGIKLSDNLFCSMLLFR